MWFALLLSVAAGVERSVPGDHPTVADAMAVSQPGDVILLTADLHEDVTLRPGVTLRGVNGARLFGVTAGYAIFVAVGPGSRVEDLEVVPHATGRCLSVGEGRTTHAVRLVCDGGRVNASALYVPGGYLICEECAFDDHAATTGSPIQVLTSGVLVLRDSTLTGGSGATSGGVSVTSGGSVLLEDLVASGNTSTAHGGALQCTQTARECTVIGGTFQGNTAPQYGGAISSGTTTTVLGATFIDNTALYGGAVRCSGGFPCEITASDFCDNDASQGGAVYHTDGSLQVRDSTFRRNAAQGFGGAVMSAFSAVDIDGSTFVGNGITGSSGGVVSGYASAAMHWGDNVFLGTTGPAAPVTPSATTVIQGYNVYFGNSVAQLSTATTDLTTDPGLLDPSAPGCDRWDLAPVGPGVVTLAEPGSDGVIGALPVIDLDGDGAWALGTHPSGDDCDDLDAAIRPGRPDDTCDGVDQDCDGQSDEDATFSTASPDVDGDGFGSLVGSVSVCAVPQGFVPSNTDCDDTLAAVNPNADELCNERDDDCDGGVDEDLAYSVWYPDVDGDGWGDPQAGESLCSVPPDRVLSGEDCDDTRASTHPDGVDAPCDGIDQDCDGVEATGGLTFADLDGDGWGDATAPQIGCPIVPGVLVPGDCDDADTGVNPDAADATCDRVDQDCDGVADEDAGGCDTGRADTDPRPDTDLALDTGAPLDTGPDTDPTLETGAPDGRTPASTGCGCDAAGGPAAGWALALGLALGRRRR